MKLINKFVVRFNTDIGLNEDSIIEKNGRYYLLSNNLKQLVTKDFFYAGTYLGKVKDKAFFPSFNLLAMIAQTDANKIVVDKRTEWLFICGRDLFKQGITDISKTRKKGDYTLVLDEHGDCLGFGKILHNIDDAENNVVVKNIADIGDFLRREK